MRLGALLLLVLTSGCTSFSSLQTARTLPEGTHRAFVGAGYFRTPVVSPSSPDRGNFPYLEGGGRFGFLEGWDIGLKYTMPGMFTGDAKFNVYQDAAFAFSLGFGMGYVAVKAGDASDTDSINREVLDLIVPSYVSYDFSPLFGIYASPRFVLRWSVQQLNLLGGALGARIGNYVGGFVEVGGAADVTSEFRQYHLAVGVFFGSGPSVPTPPG